MLTSSKEAVIFAKNLQKETPGNRVLMDMFSKIADPDYLEFFPLREKADGLRVTARVEGYSPSDVSRAKGLERLYLSASYNGRLLIVDTSPAVINNRRESWFKEKNHPDVIFWAMIDGPREDRVNYGCGEYAGVSGIWTPLDNGNHIADVDPDYCNGVARRAFSFFEDELKSASQREPGAVLVNLKAISAEPPSDLFCLN